MKRALLAVLLLGCASSQADDRASDPTPDRPNIILIVADDLGWTDLGCMGSDYYETPNIDRLAREGMTFRQAYANAANCAPSRAALMSGQYAPRTGVYTVGTSARGKAKNRKLVPTENRTELATEVVTLAETLRGAGYVSASMGKWHLGEGDECGPLAQGFDLNIAGSKAGHPKSYHAPYRNPALEDGPDGEHLTDRMGNEAVRFVTEHADERFFLYLPFFAVHTPIQPRSDLHAHFKDKPAGERHTNAKYAGLVAGMDEAVGRLLDTLANLDLERRTLILFTSDNGGLSRVTNQAPLRGSKGMFYEGGVRVPLLARWPGVIAAESFQDAPVIGVDFYPTLTELAEAQLPEQPLDGVSFLPALRGQALRERSLFWHFPAYLEAGSKNTPTPWRTTPCSVIRRGDHKLIEYFEDGRLELYDLANDIGEANNLTTAEPGLARSLHAELQRWRREIEADIPTEPNPRYSPAESDSGP